MPNSPRILPGMAALATLLCWTPPASADPGTSQGQALFERSCVACHGPDGRGSAALRAVHVHPRDFQSPRWQERTTDAYLLQVIRDGGPSVGRSPLMPAWSRLMSDDDIVSVAAYVRSLGVPDAMRDDVRLADAADTQPFEPTAPRAAIVRTQ